MTKLIIDLSDVAGGTHPDDKVVVWSPVHREGTGGVTVSTAPTTVPLVAGVGEIDVEPGPLMIQMQCRGISDTSPKEVVVPNQASISLWDLLERVYTYTPPVVSGAVAAIEQAEADALASVGTAVDNAIGTRLDAKADITYVNAEVDKSKKSRILGSTEDLNTVHEDGRFHSVISSITGNPALHYPPGAVHGYMDVTLLASSGYTSQKWTDTWTHFTASRIFQGGAWKPWVRLVDPAEKSIVDSRLGAVEDRLDRVKIQPGTAVEYGAYRPDSFSTPDTDTYWNSPIGVTFIPSDYQGDGYVGSTAGAAGYSEMRVNRPGAHLQVSCINPVTNRHVTYTVEGGDAAAYSYRDDFHIIRDIYVGAVVGGVPSMDTRLVGRSNMEWAFEMDVAGVREFAPWHGTQNTFYASPPVMVDLATGASIDFKSLPSSTVLTGVGGVKLRQKVQVAHSATPSEIVAIVEQVTTISPDGMLQSESTISVQRDFTIGANYAPMTPVDLGPVDMFTTSGGETIPLATTAPATNTYTNVLEGADFETGIFTGPDVLVAVALLNPEETFGKGLGIPPSDIPLRIETRNSGQFKLYPSPFQSGTTVPGGTTWRLGAQWRYGEASNAQQYA